MRRNSIRYLCSVLLFFLAAYLVGAASPQISPRLSVRLLFPVPKACVGGDGIDAEVAVRNASTDRATLTLDMVGYSINYHKDLRIGNRRGEPISSASRLASPRVILGPGETHWISRRIPLDANFFSEAGIYDVSVDSWILEHGASNVRTEVIESNLVYFELEDCPPK